MIDPGESLHLKLEVLYQGEAEDVKCYPIIRRYEITNETMYRNTTREIQSKLKEYSDNYIVDKDKVPSQYKSE